MRNIIIALAAATLASGASATTFVSAAVNSGANASYNGNVDVATATQSTLVPTNFGVSSLASVDGASAYNVVRASFGSADSGTIDMSWGWTIGDNSAGGSLVETNLAYPRNWTYSFVATSNGRFSGTYDVVGSGNTFGLQQLYATDDFNVIFNGTVFDPSGSGSFSVPLIAGNNYTFSVANFGNLTNGSNTVAEANASIIWTISSVPEPSSWAMLITGFGLVGVAARRRREVLA